MSWPGEGVSVPKLETVFVCVMRKVLVNTLLGKASLYQKMETAVCVYNEESSSEHFTNRCMVF